MDGMPAVSCQSTCSTEDPRCVRAESVQGPEPLLESRRSSGSGGPSELSKRRSTSTCMPSPREICRSANLSRCKVLATILQDPGARPGISTTPSKPVSAFIETMPRLGGASPPSRTPTLSRPTKAPAIGRPVSVTSTRTRVSGSSITSGPRQKFGFSLASMGARTKRLHPSRSLLRSRYGVRVVNRLSIGTVARPEKSVVAASSALWTAGATPSASRETRTPATAWPR